MNDRQETTDSAEHFDQLCRMAAALAGLSAHPPAALRLRSGELHVELDWAMPAAPVVGTAGGQVPGAVGWSGDPADPTPDSDGLAAVRAPLVGTFYRAPEPGAPPFVAPGERVEAGQQIGIVESMKLMNPVEADTEGRVVEIVVPDGTPVEYDQVLLTIAPESAGTGRQGLVPAGGEAR